MYKASRREKDYATSSAYNRQWYLDNRESVKVRGAKWRESPEVKMRRRARKFGVTVDQMIALLARNRCAICSKTEPGGNGGWHVDHDHTCCPNTKGCCGKCIRGILCHKCNVGLGHFDDDIGVMAVAIEYLTSTKRVY